jgi:hypothetical protein
VSQVSAGKRISFMDHPSYSPDLAPAAFWLFPKLKSMPKESVSRTLRTLAIVLLPQIHLFFACWIYWAIGFQHFPVLVTLPVSQVTPVVLLL